VATIVGAGIQADRVEIWTDVNGVYSADPRKVTNPILWEEINYDVAAEMALSGAKVLHPKTISPVQSENIPVIIKNTFSPDAAGTKIDNVDQIGAIGINVTTGQTLFHFSDPTMCGAVGFIYHALEIFFHAGISIDALTTSEISFTCSL
jgi:aspartate kinase